MCTWGWVSVKWLPVTDSRSNKLSYITSLYFVASRNNEEESKSQLTINVHNVMEVAKNIPRREALIFWDVKNLKFVP